MIPFKAARRLMVDGQIRTADVTDARILAAFGALRREDFVPAAHSALAYLDRDLPVGGTGVGQRRMMTPMVLGKLIHAAAIQPGERVLVVGAMTGYSAAVVSRLAESVVALEEDEGLATTAERLLAEAGAANVTVRRGALKDGAAADGPFDVILLDGAAEVLPRAFRSQLTPTGRVLAVIRSGPVGRATWSVASGSDWSGRPLFDAVAPMLPGFTEAPAFVF